MGNLLHHIGTFLIHTSALLSTACVVAHMLLARWWETPAGRHAFTFQAVLALCLGLWALRIVFGEGQWFLLTRLAAFGGVPVVLAWRLVIIIRTWRANRRRKYEKIGPKSMVV